MFQAWSDIYSNSAALRTGVMFLHIGGLLVGGGCAIAADRMTMLARPGDEQHQIAAIHGVHRTVLGGIAAIMLSGVLMLAANLDQFLVSPYFWTKMLLFTLLLINGVRLTKAEQAVRARESQGWTRLRSASMTSLVLWLLVTLFGAMLPNV